MQTDRHDKANSHFSQVLNEPKNVACEWKLCCVELGSTVSNLNFGQLHYQSVHCSSVRSAKCQNCRVT